MSKDPTGRQKIVLQPASGITLEWSSWTCRDRINYKRIQEPAAHWTDFSQPIILQIHTTSTSIL